MLRFCQWLKAELCIQAVSVAGRKQQPSQALKVWMGKNRSHEEFGDSASSVLGDDEDIANVGHRRKVARDAGKPYLASVMESCETQRVLDGAFDDGARNASSPVGTGKKVVNQPDVEARRIG